MSEVACERHPRRLTTLRCSRCERPICPSCAIQTPVGYRCRPCAQLRRLPQHEVGPVLLMRSLVAGLVVSVVAWAIVSVIPYLRYVLAILVGIAVGDVMSRLARRRTNRALDIAAVVVLIAGLLMVEAVFFGGPEYLRVVATIPSLLISLVVPIVIASIAAIARMR